LVSPEKLHALELICAAQLSCQRGCKELDRLSDLTTAIRNRLQAIDRFAWPGLEEVLPNNASTLTRWFREHWYDPSRVIALSAAGLAAEWAGIKRNATFRGVGCGTRPAGTGSPGFVWLRD